MYISIIDLMQIATGIAAIVALIFTAIEGLKNSRISQTDFLLELKSAFAEDKRYKIHVALRESKNIENWQDLDDYIGLFEICEIMIEKKTLSQKIFNQLFRYRLFNILQSDDVIIYKIIFEYDTLERFYKLLKRTYPSCKKEFDELRIFSKEFRNRNKEFIKYGPVQTILRISESDNNDIKKGIRKIRDKINNE